MHIKNFRGASQGLLAFLSVFAFAAMLGGVAFLLFYGYSVSWLGALGLFGIAAVVKFVWFGIEAKLGLREAAWILSVAGVIGIPVSGYFMWRHLVG